MQQSSQASGNMLWFAVSCKTIGGAERRMLNLATQVTKLAPELAVHFLITPDLYQQYCEDTQLGPILNNGKIKVHLAEWPKPLNTPKTTKKRFLLPKRVRKTIQLPHRIFNHLFRFLPITLKDSPETSPPENFDRLQHLSWYQEMLKHTKPGDHVHCLVAHFERNGGVLLSQHDRTVVVEITSNRAIKKVVSELKCILSKIGPCPNLQIQCVSETVYRNFVAIIGSDLLEENQISCNYYKSACLPLETAAPTIPPPRENIIMFGHRFESPKNGLLFAKVISDMYQRGELANWKVHFRGFGPEEAAIRDAVARQIADGVVDIGWSHDLEGELRRSKIFASIIETGSYPSQSVFQAMRNGNLLILGDAGETIKRFGHKDIYFTTIEASAIQKTLKQAISDAENSIVFTSKSDAMKEFFKAFSEKSNQAAELLSLHFQNSIKELILD